MSSSPLDGNSSTKKAMKVIDSHLHVWASQSESAAKYPYASPDQIPPDSLINKASTDELLKTMAKCGVDGALIVQPINHKFDHSYVADAIQSHPSKFKGMLLHDPSLKADMAVQRLEELTLKGFVGVRFNPYLWPDQKCMSSKDADDGAAGLAVYKRCAELNMPVGIMCFKGLELHYEDIIKLIEHSPNTVCILDHFGFTGLDERGDDAFKKLLSLAKYPNVIVKLSALFRIPRNDNDSYPYDKVRGQRFVPLMESFGSDRLMFGTDFPFVLNEKGSYQGAVDVVSSWAENDVDRENIMHKTAERLFGVWGGSDK